jgi:hypothetical protein
MSERKSRRFARVFAMAIPCLFPAFVKGGTNALE